MLNNLFRIIKELRRVSVKLSQICNCDEMKEFQQSLFEDIGKDISQRLKRMGYPTIL